MNKEMWTPETGFGFRTVNCPQCGIEHEMYMHNRVYNDLRCDDHSIEDLKKGQKCIWHHEDGTKTEHTIVKVNNNLCGDGCCQGYKLSGVDQYVWKTSVEGIYE